jgi:hypothetical protein
VRGTEMKAKLPGGPCLLASSHRVRVMLGTMPRRKSLAEGGQAALANRLGRARKCCQVHECFRLPTQTRISESRTCPPGIPRKRSSPPEMGTQFALPRGSQWREVVFELDRVPAQRDHSTRAQVQKSDDDAGRT